MSSEAVGWCSVDAGDRMQPASWCYRCAEGLLFVCFQPLSNLTNFVLLFGFLNRLPMCALILLARFLPLCIMLLSFLCYWGYINTLPNIYKYGGLQKISNLFQNLLRN